MLDPLTNSESSPLRRELGLHAIICLVFAGLCLLTSLFVSAQAGERKLLSVPASGTDEPIEFTIDEDNAVYHFEIEQNTQQLRANQGWSVANIRILDPEGNLLFGFGDEFWRANGVDAEGYAWSETQREYDMHYTFPLKGTYQLEVETETNQPNFDEPVNIRMIPQAGSKSPFYVGAFIGVLAAGGIGAFRHFKT